MDLNASSHRLCSLPSSSPPRRQVLARSRSVPALPSIQLWTAVVTSSVPDQAASSSFLLVHTEEGGEVMLDVRFIQGVLGDESLRHVIQKSGLDRRLLKLLLQA